MSAAPQPVFSLCYTSRRPDCLADVVRRWLESAAAPHDVEIVVALDADDVASRAAATNLPPTVRVVIQEVVPGNCVLGWNAAAAQARGLVLIVISDDFFPPPQWDAALLALPPKGWPQGEYAVHVRDGDASVIMTIQILTRRRYRRFGFLFYPGYRSMTCDREFTERAYDDGIVIQAPQLLFEHRHWMTGARERDGLDVVHSAPERTTTGRELMQRRLPRGFPTDAGPLHELARAAAARPVGEKFAACLTVTDPAAPLPETLRNLHLQGVRAFFIGLHEPAATPSSGSSRARIESTADVFRRETGAVVHFRSFAVTPTPDGVEAGLHEGRLRNEQVEWVLSHGFWHLLIVDDNELWLQGAVARIDRLVREGDPAAITAGVVGAQDGLSDPQREAVTLYLRGTERFSDGRRIHGAELRLKSVEIVDLAAPPASWSGRLRRALGFTAAPLTVAQWTDRLRDRRGEETVEELPTLNRWPEMLRNDPPTILRRGLRMSLKGNWLPRLLLGAGGEWSGEAIRPRLGQAGHLFYGPHIYLAPGVYRVRLTLANVPPQLPELRDYPNLDVVCAEHTLAERRLRAADLQAQVFDLDFTVPREIWPMVMAVKVEIRLWTEGSVEFLVTGVYLEKIRDG
jgi:hypothetical protein